MNLNCCLLHSVGEKSSVIAVQFGMERMVIGGLESTGGKIEFLAGITKVF